MAIPTLYQERAVDPFASYHSNVVNQLVRVVTKGKDCILQPRALDVISDTTSPESKVIVTSGFCIKDNVLIWITQDYEVDFNNVDFYPLGGNFNKVGYYFVCLDYTYQKARPAPQARITILDPNQHNLLASMMFLKAAYVIFDGTSMVISSLHDWYPTNPTIKREFAPYYFTAEPYLPEFDQVRDEARLVYVMSSKTIWYGGPDGWLPFDPAKIPLDTTSCSLNDLVYIGAQGKAHPAIATDPETCALAVAISIGGPSVGIGQILGKVSGIKLETGVECNAGDSLYLSDTQAGRVTPNAPDEIAQYVGEALTDSTSSQDGTITIIFDPDPKNPVDYWRGYYADKDIDTLFKDMYDNPTRLHDGLKKLPFTIQNHLTTIRQFSGMADAYDASPDYTSTNYIDIGDSLTLAISKLDQKLGTLDSVLDNLEAIRQFVGMDDLFDSTPDYTSNNYILDGDSLETAISKLDSVIGRGFTSMLAFTGMDDLDDGSTDYCSNHYIDDGDPLETAICKLDQWLYALTHQTSPFFTLSAPSTIDIRRLSGQSGTAALPLTITPFNGFAGLIQLSIIKDDGSAETRFSLTPTTISIASGTTSPVTQTLAISCSSGIADGNYTIKIKGISGSLQTATENITAVVSTQGQVPDYPEFLLTCSPNFVNAVVGNEIASFVSLTLTNTRSNGWSGDVELQFLSGVAGATAVINPGSIYFSGTSMTISVALSHSPINIVGTFQATIKASTFISGTEYSASTTFSIIVAAAPSQPKDILFAASPASLNLVQNSTSTILLRIVPVNGFTGTVNLAISTPPSATYASAQLSSSFVIIDSTNAEEVQATVIATSNIGSTSMTLTASASGVTDKTVTIPIEVKSSVPSDFSISCNPQAVTIERGTQQTYSHVYIIPNISGFIGNVNLVATCPVSGVTITPSPSSVSLNGTEVKTASLIIQIADFVIPQTTQITVTGTSGQVSRTSTLTLTISDTASGFSIIASPSSLTIPQGQSSTTTIYVSKYGTFNKSITISCLNTPSNVTINDIVIDSTSISGQVTISVGGSATIGSYSLTFRGISEGISTDCSVTLQVVAGVSSTFSMAISPTSAQIYETQYYDYLVTLTSIGTFTGTINLSSAIVSGSLPDTTISFRDGNAGTNSVILPSAGSSKTITLRVQTGSGTVTNGVTRYATIKVTANSGSITREQDVQITVLPQSKVSISAPYSLEVEPGTGISVALTLTPKRYSGPVEIGLVGAPSSWGLSKTTTNVSTTKIFNTMLYVPAGTSYGTYTIQFTCLAVNSGILKYSNSCLVYVVESVSPGDCFTGPCQGDCAGD
jgi:hypothetical protein